MLKKKDVRFEVTGMLNNNFLVEDVSNHSNRLATLHKGIVKMVPNDTTGPVKKGTGVLFDCHKSSETNPSTKETVVPKSAIVCSVKFINKKDYDNNVREERKQEKSSND